MRPALGDERGSDRYQPLPGILALPGFLYRKLSPRGRMAAVGALVVLLVAGGVATAILVPRISESKRDTAERERRQAARFRAAERRRLEAEGRPRRGRLATVGDVPTLLDGLEAAIETDARLRLAAGEIRTPVRRADCRSLGEERRRLVASCVAITSDVPGRGGSRGVRVGYPYRALLDPEDGSYAFCKTSGRPAEGALGAGVSVPLPRACGG